MACSSYKQKTTTLPKGTKLQIHSTEQGQIGMIAPAATLTPQGAADTGYAGDCWQFNTKGELVRAQRQYRKTLFTPSRAQCPVPAEQLEDYRRTTIRFKDGTTNKMETMEEPNKAQQQMSKGEAAFRTKKGTTLPETLQPQFATKTQPKSAPQKVTPQAIQRKPRTRLKEKTTPPTMQDAAPHTTIGAAGRGLPHPSEVHPGGDYWYREGPYWKRAHATHTLETDQGTASWRKTQHKIGRI